MQSRLALLPRYRKRGDTASRRPDIPTSKINRLLIHYKSDCAGENTVRPNLCIRRWRQCGSSGASSPTFGSLEAALEPRDDPFMIIVVDCGSAANFEVIRVEKRRKLTQLDSGYKAKRLTVLRGVLYNTYCKLSGKKKRSEAIT